MKRHDADDPYLVVAADKGTATFSDYANGISQEYGFWLGDAFASGGSVGYDHKAMGITARGAWESVKRHFREMGIDTQTTDFTVAGIGDMSGDVFGNGMLLSRHIRLVAAFDHRHIFLDPNPDAASELRRARAAVQAAALVVGRLRREADLAGRRHPSAQREVDRDHAGSARRRSTINGDAMTPTELVNAILKAPVDLLYNGGIGTYVKATSETHAQVGDRANDALRVNGSELRCKVVAEGGNLGCTQLGPHRVRAGRRADLHRRDRQLGGRGHVRPRGQHQDPARPADRRRRADREAAQRAARGDDRRRRRAGAARQLLPDAGAVGHGPHRAAAARCAAALHPVPREERDGSTARSNSCRPTRRSPSAARAARG